MIDLSTKAVKLRFTPRDPEQWGSVDSWMAAKKFYCGYATLSSEQQVRAGRDSAERGLRVWYRDITLASGDRLRIGGNEWLVVYVDEQGDVSGVQYCDVKAAV
ncbi:MAG: hypothetical protein C0436_00035 [Alphaproteobacteria bacterium]|nr:hypothetical protein [Alphaproteobacteria bacterium]